MRIPQVPWPLVWAVLQLGWRPGWLLGLPDGPGSPLTFCPARLAVPEGDNATFTCSFHNTSEHLVLNWYRISPGNQTDKLATFPEDHRLPHRDGRFRVTPLPNGRDFHMSILAAQRNDSGIYFCGAIPKAQITESPRAELMVTERAVEPTAQPSPSPGPAGKFQGLVVGISSVLVGVLVLLLLAWVLATCSRTTRASRGARPEDQSLKEDPSVVPVFTVDYGELDFQWREKTPEPPVPCLPEQTEYATIIFPNGLDTSYLGRRGSADGPRGPRPLRPEDGHCSWPL
ncbi:PREDICTED: programmed cell death protein 1 [Galeopterus variegatus]|uniref:Programmed cell death protein 1 n=1 Tax=Galeopterus variegatus TaxID=482537 RepID=A0ABM0R8N2_GALVR|nr:PREDICTED: programmed cell death protein 1 [Galeopterus variegatus]